MTTSRSSVLNRYVCRLVAIIKNKESFVFACIVATIAFFHFYNLGYGEFVNDETIAVAYSVYVAHGFENPLLFGSLFIYPHPPIRILANLPFLFLFGSTEAAMRFPHALFGALSIIPLYLVAKKLYGRNVAILAGLLYAFSGASAVNRQSQGVGIYVFFVLLAFYYLTLYIKRLNHKSKSRYLILTSASLAVATFTYLEAVVFVLPVLYIVAHKRGLNVLIKDRQAHWAGLLYFGSLVCYFLLWFVMPKIASNLGYVNTFSSGNMQHISQRASGLLAFNLVPIVIQYVEYNSIFSTLLLLVGIVAGVCLRRRDESFMINALYLLPHLFTWTFVFKNIVMHPMYDFPLVALLAAAGVEALTRSRPRFKPLSGAMIGLLLLLSGWHHYVSHNQDSISPGSRNLVFGSTINHPIQKGSKAAGYYIRTHSQDVSEQVFVYGSGAAHFYSGRLDKAHDVRSALMNGEIADADDLDNLLLQSPTWTKVRYLIITDDDQVLQDYARTNYALEAIVTVKSEPSLYIFDAKKPARDALPNVIASEEYRERYDQAFSYWRTSVPWFLPMVQARFK